MIKYINDYDRIINEHFDMRDNETRQHLLSLTEAEEQNGILVQLTTKLYNHITEKITDIDFGTIPQSKGDITKIDNYNQLVESVEVMREILVQNKQDTAPMDIIQKAIFNIEDRSRDFENAFKFDNELPIMIYCTTVLAIVSSVSLMISSSIEYIKDPTNEGFKVALDRTGLSKTKDNLLFKNLNKFNTACDKGTIDETISEMNKNKSKNFLGELVIIKAVVLTGIALTIIPILRELIYFFYNSRVKMSEYFEIQAELLQMNIYELDLKDEIEELEKNKIKEKQQKIVNIFKKISNSIALSNSKATTKTEKDIVSDSSEKYTMNDMKSDSILF